MERLAKAFYVAARDQMRAHLPTSRQLRRESFYFLLSKELGRNLIFRHVGLLTKDGFLAMKSEPYLG